MAMQLPVSRRSLHRFGIGGAWFFIVVSLLHLAWVYTALLPGPGSSTAKLYHTVVAGQSYDAIGLTYSGIGGVLQVTVQALLLVGAIGATVFAGRRWRRAGHAVLVLWAGLWLGNLLWLTGLDHSLQGVGQSTVMAALFACTAYRAAVNWNGPAGRSQHHRDADVDDSFRLLVPDDDACNDQPPLTAEDIEHSDAVRPLGESSQPWIRVDTIRRRVKQFRQWAARTAGQAAARTAPIRQRISHWLRRWGLIPQPQHQKSN